MNYIDYLIMTCEQFARLGDVKLSNGARRLGHTPVRAPMAYFHLLNDGLLPGEIDALEMIIKRQLPQPLKEFYRRINGGHFFASELSIYGLRRSFGRTIEDAAQPFAMERCNVMSRPWNAPDSAVLFAFYMDDGARLAAFPDRAEIVAIPDGVWPNLEVALVSEFDRLGKFFNSEGHKFDPDAHCSPITETG